VDCGDVAEMVGIGLDILECRLLLAQPERLDEQLLPLIPDCRI
jgi:hypothetical protein